MPVNTVVLKTIVDESETESSNNQSSDSSFSERSIGDEHVLSERRVDGGEKKLSSLEESKSSSSYGYGMELSPDPEDRSGSIVNESLSECSDDDSERNMESSQQS